MPTIAETLTLALQLHQNGRLDDAVQLYRDILAVHPRHPGALHLLSQAYATRGKLVQARRLAHAALVQEPGNTALWLGAAVIAHQDGRLPEAVISWRRALTVTPDSVEALNNIAQVLQAAGDPANAELLFKQALAHAPALAVLHGNLGLARKDQNNLDGAIAALRISLRLDDRRPVFHHNLGNALAQAGDFTAAIRHYDRALAQDPQLAETHTARALALLALGAFDTGWAAYEWRWRQAATTPFDRRFSARQWRGEPLDGATILLHAEQGLGDTLQFCRYVPMVVARGGRVILEVQRELVRLMATLSGGSAVIAVGDPLPDFTWQCPLMSLPLAFQTRRNDIPAAVPYLAADPARVAAWHQHWAAANLADRFKVGLVWAGNPRPGHPAASAIDRRRSITIDQCRNLATIPGIVLVSLQKGSRAAEAATLPGLIDLSAALDDFVDTAAVIETLDVVVTVDTSVAHLAGALAKPVWVLSRFDGCWRWLRDRDDSPWYPTLTLYRQHRPGDWAEPLARLAADLTERAANEFSSRPIRLQEAEI
ncbi:MAG: tetratricopeptide repeat protein [Azospirillaceae bacterium]|nr:tetratricopeptide repeat protein [Azospirillaceae bacterium]